MASTFRPATSLINHSDNTTYTCSNISAHRHPVCRVKLSIRRLQARTEQSSMVLEARTRTADMEMEKLHAMAAAPREYTNRGVPVFVMLPLDTVSMEGSLNRPRAMAASLTALKSAGVEGVMVDAWWGLVEKDGPMKYNWDGYEQLVKLAEKVGLKLQVVMSFHQCGGNVGDSCSIPLPPWVLEEMREDPDLMYTDKSGRRNPEYISLGCDSLPVLRGRTPIQVYSDCMASFRDKFNEYLGNVIVEIQVGMGPCGELRYPSYPEANGTWRFPGIGEFQCYDKYMRASLAAAAEEIGKKDWGRGGPHDSGQYKQHPEETGFFRREGTWNTDYGRFFLEWYSSKLLEHGEKILTAAGRIFQGRGARLSGKVAGIHWHYKTRSHAAELTAGYYNTRNRDGYIPIARMLAKHGVIFNFTCMEMRDGEQVEGANSSPEGLVRQVKMAAKMAKAELAGENALERYDGEAFSQVVATSKSESRCRLSAFTYLRMNKRLFEADNWRNLVEFVRSMSGEGEEARLPEIDRVGTQLYIGFLRHKDAVGKTCEAAASYAMNI